MAFLLCAARWPRQSNPWRRGRLRHPELTAGETLNELHWHADRISAEWEEEFLPLN